MEYKTTPLNVPLAGAMRAALPPALRDEAPEKLLSVPARLQVHHEAPPLPLSAATIHLPLAPSYKDVPSDLLLSVATFLNPWELAGLRALSRSHFHLVSNDKASSDFLEIHGDLRTLFQRAADARALNEYACLRVHEIQRSLSVKAAHSGIRALAYVAHFIADYRADARKRKQCIRDLEASDLAHFTSRIELADALDEACGLTRAFRETPGSQTRAMVAAESLSRRPNVAREPTEQIEEPAPRADDRRAFEPVVVRWHGCAPPQP